MYAIQCLVLTCSINGSAHSPLQREVIYSKSKNGKMMEQKRKVINIAYSEQSQWAWFQY